MKSNQPSPLSSLIPNHGRAPFALKNKAGWAIGLVLLFQILLSSSRAFAAPAFVQKKDFQVTSGTTNRVSFTQSTTAGNLIVVYLIWDSTGNASVADSFGNAYMSPIGPTRWSGGKYSSQIFYATNTGSGGLSVTATFATKINTFGIIYAHEYSGIAQNNPVDAVAAATGTAGALNSGTATTSNAVDLIFGGGVSANSVTRAGTGFTARSTSQGNITEDHVVSAAGSYAATAANSSGAWGMQMVAFRGVSTPGKPADSPTVPAGLTATATSSSAVTLSWKASTDPNNTPSQLTYGLYRNGNRVAISAAGATSWSDSGLTAGTTYSYTICAYDPAGNSSAQSAAVQAKTQSQGASLKPYSTNFPSTENPISEGGNWINGKSVGIDWGNVQTTSGFAFGTNAGGYADPTAILSGNWGPDQTAQAVVRCSRPTDSAYEEVELRLRSTITAHNNSGYEINFRCSKTSNAYSQVVRWNGALGDFTYVGTNSGSKYGVQTGDVVKASIKGSVITTYINNVQMAQFSDTRFTSGNPGMGFYLDGASGNISDYGFTSFTASDGSATDTTPPTTPDNLAANGSTAPQIDLAWNPATDNVAVTGYQVIRDGAQIATAASPSYSDKNVATGISYSYAVAAVDAAGNVSAPTPTVSAAVSSQSSDVTPPSLPANLQYSGVGATAATITWTASTDNVAVSGYRVYRDGTQIATTAQTSYKATGLNNSTTYQFTVAAYDPSNNVSDQSQPLSVTTTSAPQNTPSIVQLNQNQIANGSSTSVNFNTSTVAGNTIVAYVIWNNAGAAVLNDSRGNTFVNIGQPVTWGNGYSAQVFYASNISGGSDTVTATFRIPVTSFGVVYIHEYSGISATDPIDVTASASGSSSTLNSGSIVTTSPNDLIFGAGVSDNVTTAAGSGFTQLNMSYGNITENLVAPSTGSYAATATHNGKMWGMQVIAFRPAQ